MDVIAREGVAFWNKDFSAWASHWVHSEYVHFMGWWPAGGVTVVEGFEMLGALMRETMGADPGANPNAQTVRRERLNLQVRGDTARVTFDQSEPTRVMRAWTFWVEP